MVEEEGGNIQVRQFWDQEANVMTVFGEYKVIPGLVPDDFRTFFEQWDVVGAAANDTIDTVDKCGTDSGVDTLKIVALAPWPIWNRVMFSTRYLEMDIDDGHMMLFSGAGNKHFENDEAIFTAEEKGKLVVATIHMSGFWVKPAKNAAGEVIGAHLLYYNAIDLGGLIPTFVQNSKGPQTTLNSIKGPATWVTANKAK